MIQRISITLSLFLFSLFPSQANAADFSKLTFKLLETREEMRETCQAKLHTRGCYFADTDTIVIYKNLSKQDFAHVFYHEIGHFLMKDVPDEKIQELFFFSDRRRGEEIAAISFSFWVQGKSTLPPKYDEFFRWLLVR